MGFDLECKEDILQLIKPVRLKTCEITTRRDIKGCLYYIIHNPETDAYIKLNSNYFQLYSGMDGKTNLSRIVTMAFADCPFPNSEKLKQFLLLLQKSGIITLGQYSHSHILESNDASSTPSNVSKWRRLFRSVINVRLTYSDADSFVTWLYEHGGKVIYKRLSITIALSVIILSVPSLLLFSALHDSNPTIHENLPPLLPTDISIMAAIICFSLTLHEVAHALTCKHYGRKVSRMGVMLYYGFPAFFTDTTDACMLPRFKRVAIDAAGMLANFLIAWLAFVLMVVFSASAYFALKFCVAFNLFIMIYNLIPFLKYDGYYIITDLLEMPNLRENSIQFLFRPSKRMHKLNWNKSSLFDCFIFFYGFLSIVFALLVLSLATISIFLLISHFLSPIATIPVMALSAGGIFYYIRRRRCRSP